MIERNVFIQDKTSVVQEMNRFSTVMRALGSYLARGVAALRIGRRSKADKAQAPEDKAQANPAILKALVHRPESAIKKRGLKASNLFLESFGETFSDMI